MVTFMPYGGNVTACVFLSDHYLMCSSEISEWIPGKYKTAPPYRKPIRRAILKRVDNMIGNVL